jgi:hypothetical protein
VKHDVVQVLGMAVMVVFGQGLIRILVDHGDRGLLGWLPGGFTPALLAHTALTALGAALTSRAHTRAKALGRR